MKRVIACIAALYAVGLCYAEDNDKNSQKEPDYQFTTIKELPVTSVKDQYRSGTCWCFSALSFLESELLRTQNKTYDLSEMWIVGHSYHDRGIKYVRLDGKMGFSQGSGFGDVFAVINKYGIVPNEVYNGMHYGTEKPEQGELDAVLSGYLNAIVRNPNKKCLSTAWRRGFDAVIQAYLGQWPEQFEYEGVDYTPASYAQDALKFNSDEYVNLCSFIEEPLYKQVPIDVCDNWRNFPGYNVTLAEMMDIIYHAIDEGYTVLWGGDVSEKGFTRNGIGVMPKEKAERHEAGSDQEHWVGKEEKKEDDASVEIPEEIEVNDALRQDAYDRKMTTDDHGMHIFGYAKDQNGTKYLMVKNSWGETGKYKGVWYMSDTFVSYKTLNIVVNKKALSREMAKKLGLK